MIHLAEHMRVVFFSRLFYPHIGGVEKHVFEVSKVLKKAEYSVAVFAEKYSSELRQRDTIEGIDIYRIPILKNNWFKKFRIWKYLWKYRKFLQKADVIHCHDVFFWYLPFRFIFPKKRVYITFHGYETKFPLSTKAILIRKLSEKLAQGSICVGEYIKKWYGTNPYFVTYGGVRKVENSGLEVKNYTSKKLRSTPAFIARKIKVIFVGRLEQDTGIPIYLKALEILQSRQVPFQFQAVGDGSLRPAVEKFGTVFGFQKNTQQYVISADIVFASSYLSILEALSAKKVVFSIFENPLKKDYLINTPFSKYIRIHSDPKKLADDVEYFWYNTKERNEIVNSGTKWVKNQTWEKVAETYMKLWNL